MVFAIRFSKTKEDKSAKITFGDYDRGFVGNKAILWERKLEGNRWNMSVAKMVYDGKVIERSKKSWIAVTTGENRLRIYRKMFLHIEAELKKNLKCRFKTEDPIFYCEVPDRSLSRFKVLEIHLSKTVIYVEPHEYVEFVRVRCA